MLRSKKLLVFSKDCRFSFRIAKLHFQFYGNALSFVQNPALRWLGQSHHAGLFGELIGSVLLVHFYQEYLINVEIHWK